MAAIVYILCAFASLICAILLLRGHFRNKQARLLLWSGLCFFALSINNFVLFVDLVLVPDINFAVFRVFVGFVGMCLLLYGMIWETD